MQSVVGSDIHIPRRVAAWLAGLAAGATLSPWLAREFDVPSGIRANGGAAFVCSCLLVAGWTAATLRYDVVSRWYGAHRGAVLRAARWAGRGYGAVFVGLFYLMWTLGRIDLGEWPQAMPMHDPKGIPLAAVGYILICAWFWCLPLALAFPLGRSIYSGRNDLSARIGGLRDFAVTIVVMAAAGVWLHADPHELVKWFLD